MARGIIYKLDDRGHGEVTRWSDDLVSQEKAASVFKGFQDRYYTMADMTRGEGTVMERFDPEAKEILAVPMMIRG